MPDHKRPFIAVTGSVAESLFSWDWWSWQCIRLAIWSAGGIPKRTTAEKRISNYDGLLLSGGVDISPELYGQQNTSSYRCEAERDRFEAALLEEAMAQKKPVLGICRGAQFINVARGGTLHQDAGKVFRYYTP